MSLSKRLIVAFVCAGALSCTNVGAMPAASSITRVASLDSLADQLQPFVNRSHQGAQVYYRASCHKDGGFQSLSFPGLQLRRVSGKETGLHAIRAMLPKGAVVESRSGSVYVRLGKIPEQLIRTRIDKLVFSPDEQFTDVLAVMAIERNPDVRAAMQKLGYNLPLEDISVLPSKPQEGAPHLPPTLSHVTIDEAFNLVAKTFRGIVFVGFCEKERVWAAHAKGGYDWMPGSTP
jgi:hypothetical protein